MGKQRSSCDAAAHRAWRLLRLALIWARKGGLLKCRLMAELRHGAKYLKGLNHRHDSGSRDMIQYGHRELSFDDTPVIRLRMSRHASLRFMNMIPCIKPQVVDFDYDFGGHDVDNHDDDDDDAGWGRCGGKRSFLQSKAGDYEDHDEYDDDDDQRKNEECDEDEGIDVKAEEFIAKFYNQMKLQREISFQRRYK